MITKIWNKSKVGVTSTPRQDVIPKYRSFNYIPGLCGKLAINFRQFDNSLNLAYKPPKTVNTLFSKLKDPIDKLNIKSVVYKIDCKNKIDCKKTYIGQTGKALKTRIQQHKRDVINIKLDIEQRNNNNISHTDTVIPETNKQFKTALTKHLYMSENRRCSFDFENVKIIDREKNKQKRETLEALHIKQSRDHVVNYRVDTQFINRHYSEILALHNNLKNGR